VANSVVERLLARRIGRRRALAAAGGATGAAALLAACGSSGTKSGGGSTSNVSNLVSMPVDTTKQARAGGTMKWYHYSDVATFDPGFANAPNETPKLLANCWLVQYEPGILKPSENNVVPDLMESWEFSPDKTQLTFKMRQGVTWHNKSPVNGRALDAEDILFSWNRVQNVNSNRTVLANSANPDAPILSVTAPDAKTIVVKLKQPLSYVLAMLAYTVGGSFAIVPKETDTTLDIRRDILGTGPYVLDKYEPSVGFTYKRFDNYYEKDKKFPATLEMPIVTEYAQRLAQFRAGNLFQSDVRSEDITSVKREEPQINIFQGDIARDSGHVAFGWKQAAWLDERMRQALSMSWDRDTYLDTVRNVSKFRSEGLPIESRWATALYPDFEGYWLDPKGKDFGANAKYYQYNVAEAKKLMAAAGFANGLDVISTTPAGNAYGIDYNKNLDIVEGFARDAGFRIRRNEIDYTSDFIPNYRNAKGQHEGWAQKIGPGFATDAIGRYAYEFWSKGGDNFYGFSASGKNDMAGDPQVDNLIEKAQLEIDNDKRKQIAFDLQRLLAQKQYLITHPGGATQFLMAWPVVGNFGVYRASQGTLTPRIYWWVDDTKAPLKRA
jgi:peptide/nickel transport system substrate-binding protein